MAKWASLVAQSVKNLPAVQETQVRSLGREDPLEKEMSTHSRILAWKIPWTEETGGLQSTGSQRVGHDWVTNTYLLMAKWLVVIGKQNWWRTSNKDEENKSLTRNQHRAHPTLPRSFPVDGAVLGSMWKRLTHLERRCWWTYLQGKNGDAHIENRLLDTVGEGEGGMIWESSIETYTFHM